MNWITFNFLTLWDKKKSKYQIWIFCQPDQPRSFLSKSSHCQRQYVALILRPSTTLDREKSPLPLHQPIEAFPPSEEVFCKVQQIETWSPTSKNMLSHTSLSKTNLKSWPIFSDFCVFNNTIFEFYTIPLSLPAHRLRSTFWHFDSCRFSSASRSKAIYALQYLVGFLHNLRNESKNHCWIEEHLK